MCVQSKLVWEVSRYRNGGLAGGWWCGVTWSVRTCVGSVEGPELFETGASFDSFPSLARRNRSWRIIRENRLNKLTKLVKIDHTQSDLSIEEYLPPKLIQGYILTLTSVTDLIQCCIVLCTVVHTGKSIHKIFCWNFAEIENFKLFSAHLHPNLKSLANDRSQHLVKDHHACLYCLSNARPRHLQTHHQANLCVGQAIQSLKDIYYAVEKSCPVGSYIGGAYFFSKV